MSFNPEKSHAITLSHRKDHTANPLIYFLNNSLKKVQSLEFLHFTLSHDLSWANHISKLASRASHQLGIFHRAKSFLGIPQLLSTDEAFIHSLMEHCSPLWAGTADSHSAQLDAVDSRAFKSVEISHDEAEYGFMILPSQIG